MIKCIYRRKNWNELSQSPRLNEESCNTNHRHSESDKLSLDGRRGTSPNRDRGDRRRRPDGHGDGRRSRGCSPSDGSRSRNSYSWTDGRNSCLSGGNSDGDSTAGDAFSGSLAGFAEGVDDGAEFFLADGAGLGGGRRRHAFVGGRGAA
jgi:hypothetical protein